ncbi:cinnamoyl-CoA reductase 1-like protein [Cinnamomum micranthum f. kanehirae]|uniref:Cinnamoyl-CoA reductase 1-like protein n=1 Tax=Cinnamomum micranthum f. kanehirae TaxID=337451 RepID=A0A443PVI9_9MAGN|nr:cinnamoyl-CoA reductase 1-like protein [Cinnamomum micranthum f. kanehirae]
MSGKGKLVCVTGASGYIASWLVKLLLNRGYTIRASVRDPKGRKDNATRYGKGKWVVMTL